MGGALLAALTAVPDGTDGDQRAVEAARKPTLQVVRRRRRWPVVVAGFVVVLLLAAMLGAAVFHTQLAERQLEIDALGVEVEAERDRYDELRNSIASKQNPQELTAAAEQLGLMRAPQPTYLEVDRWALAIQLASAGPVADSISQIIVEADPLDQFREIKSLSAGQP